MVFAIVTALLSQYLLALIFMDVTAIVDVVTLPKMLQAKTGDVVETVAADISGPLRFKDVFSWYFLPKLERIYGEYTAVSLCVGTLTAVVSTISLLMYLLDIVTAPAVGVITVVALVFFLMIYCQMTGRMRNHRFGW
jgi:hypothetical protein